jgi:TusA-related sulfurtransferase
MKNYFCRRKRMKFLEKELPANLSVDIVHLMCPIHLLELNESIKKIELGQIIELTTDYDRALEKGYKSN